LALVALAEQALLAMALREAQPRLILFLQQGGKVVVVVLRLEAHRKGFPLLRH